MRLLLSICLTIFVASKMALAENIVESAQAAQANLATLQTKPIPGETLDRLGALLSKLSVGGIMLNETSAKENLISTQEILQLLLKMRAANRIWYISDEVKNSPELHEFLCHPECRILKGFYLPLVHQIFIEPSLSEQQQALVLFHELFHAYQFSYRLPIDLHQMITAGIGEDSLANYLNYFYEAQSNWRAFRLSPEPAWQKYLGVDRSAGNVASTTVKFYLKGLFPIPIAGIVINKAIDNSMTNDYLPPVFRADLMSEKDYHGANRAIVLPELVPVKEWTTVFNLTSNFNFGFHHHFGQSVEKTYFGSTKFLFTENRDDLRIYNQLHQEYYSVFIPQFEKLRYSQACQNLFWQEGDSASSPLVKWVTVTDEQMKTCSLYSHSATQAERDLFSTAYLRAHQNSASPFSGFSKDDPISQALEGPGGGEGSGGSLSVLPSQVLLPQLSVEPLDAVSLDCKTNGKNEVCLPTSQEKNYLPGAVHREDLHE